MTGLAVRRTPLLAVATVFAAFVLAPSVASAATHTKTYEYPVSMKPYEVRQTLNLVDRPNVNGFITGMSVNVVNADGTSVPIQRLMLHHIVFFAIGQPNPTCSSFTGYDSRPMTSLGNYATPIYGAGEERNVLVLPKGYGVPISKVVGEDAMSKLRRQWGMVWMLMNHRGVSDHALIRYTVTWDDNPDLTPVKGYWLDVRNCQADPIFNVPGGGAKDSTYRQTYDYTMPDGGVIVAGGGHVHGGAKKLKVSEPDCNNRTVFQSNPAWGTAAHPFYHVRPILHEPGPISMSGMLSEKGYPIAKGERVRLTADYDNQLPHTRVMGISMIYVAHKNVPKCGKRPGDIQHLQPAALAGIPYRKHTPRFTVPLTRLGGDGKAHEIEQPPGARQTLANGSTISVFTNDFGPRNALVARNTTLRWRFNSTGYGGLHNVTLASGTRGFASKNLNDGRTYRFTFRAPGRYKIFCALHPVQMQETVLVK
jgi:plastocyanin